MTKNGKLYCDSCGSENIKSEINWGMFTVDLVCRDCGEYVDEIDVKEMPEFQEVFGEDELSYI